MRYNGVVYNKISFLLVLYLIIIFIKKKIKRFYIYDLNRSQKENRREELKGDNSDPYNIVCGFLLLYLKIIET
jgi:hypothetical protein